MQNIPPAPVIPVEAVPLSAPPPVPPRAVTAGIRRRIWLEPRVRRWWLLGALILLTFFAYAGDRLWARVQETRLIRSGVLMQAKIVAAENMMTNMPFGPGDMARLEVNWTKDTAEDLTGHLSGNNFVGGTVMVHIDPADHSLWTDRSEPTPLLDSLLIGLLMLPMIPVMLWIGFLQAKKLLGTWQNGSAQVAVVFDRKQSPIAPLSYVIRASLQNGRQKDLFTVHVPRIGYGLEKGNLIWVLTPMKKGRPLSVLWMAGETG